MKKHLCILLVIFFVLSVVQLLSSVSAKMPESDSLNGYENVCLTYTFDYYAYNRGAHTVEDLRPYVGYYNQEGKLCDYFFDSYLFLPAVGYGPSGGSMFASFANPSNATDWISYVNDTFRSDVNVDALNTAFGNAKKELNDTSDKKAGVFFTILYPTNTATNFGTLGGRTLDLSILEDRKYAVKWIIDEQVSKFNEGEYENLENVGFYWLEEYVFNYAYTDEDLELLDYTADYLHSLGLKFIWIPWYNSFGVEFLDELGFDVVCMQPNLFWMGDYQADYDRVKDSINTSIRNGMCMEVEIDSRAFTSSEYFKRYLIYLEDGMKYGAMDSVKMYYQDKKTGVYYTAANSNSFQYRVIYDLTYKYAKGTLTETDILRAKNNQYPLDLPEPPLEPNQPEAEFKLGDINADGFIDAYDYILCKRIYFNNYFPTEDEYLRANVDKKDDVDVYDYILLKRHHFGTYVIN